MSMSVFSLAVLATLLTGLALGLYNKYKLRGLEAGAGGEAGGRPRSVVQTLASPVLYCTVMYCTVLYCAVLYTLARSRTGTIDSRRSTGSRRSNESGRSRCSYLLISMYL